MPVFAHSFSRRLSIALLSTSVLILAGCALSLGIAFRGAHPKTVTSSNTVTGSLPILSGSEAVDHLKQQGLYGSLAEAMAAARYGAQPLPSANGYQFANPANDFRATLTSTETRIVSSGAGRGGELVIKLIGCGYGSRLRAVTDGKLGADRNRVENRRGELVEWFVNTPAGIEHGFELAAPPATGRAGDEELRVWIEIGGDWRLRLDEAGQTATFTGANGETALIYNKLRVYDARKCETPSHFEMEGERLAIVVDDRKTEYPLTIDPLLAQQAKLTANDGMTNDIFGSSVAIGGNTVVIGAPSDDVVVNNQGSAYVFVRSGATWSQQARLNATDGSGGDSFGGSVAIDKDTVVVGALGDNFGANADQGSAYVFTRAGSTWSLQQKLTAADGAADDNFGRSVAISGDTVVVGASGDNIGANAAQGSAYVFTRAGSTWSLQQKLTAGDGAANDQFGVSVAIDADTVVVGAVRNVGANTARGSVYVFSRAGSAWSLQQKLTAIGVSINSFFGSSVAISGDTVVVGALGDNIGANVIQGSAFVFTRAGSAWSQQQKLTAADGAEGDQFGQSVAISGDAIVVGALGDNIGANAEQGSAYVFTRDGSTWSQQQQITAADGASVDLFGASVAIDSGTVVVGAFGDTIGANAAQGSAYIFIVCNGLLFQQTLRADDGAAGDAFGFSVAISGDTVVVGAFRDDIGANADQGSAYVFTRDGSVLRLQAQLRADDGAAGDQFGRSVAIYLDTIVVGAPIVNSSRGAAYVFTRAGSTWTQQPRLVANDRSINDFFGVSVAIHADTVVVGANLDSVGANTFQGSAYVFVRNGATWTQQARLNADDGAPNDQFGVSVAIHADTVVVGASLDDRVGSPDQGSAYVFVRSGLFWSQEARLNANDGVANDLFGVSVSIYADTVVVGASADDIGANTNQGSAYIFVRRGSNWSQQRQLTAADGAANDFFGSSVAIDMDTVVVGASMDDTQGNADQGSAHVFVRRGLTWSLQQQLAATDGAASDFLGVSVAISGGAVLIGASGDDNGANADQGSAHVFGCGGCSTIGLDPDTLPTGVIGRSYNQNITASGGGGTINFSLSSGSLPLGLTFSQTGLISGIPVAAGTRNITITATAPSGCVGAQDYSIAILSSFTTVSAASFVPALTPTAIVAGFGVSLANSTAGASSLPLPTVLAGASVMVRDVNGVERASPLFFASPFQINYQIPAGTAAGAATVMVFNGAQAVATGAAQIAAIAPAIFTLTQDGTGAAAAVDALTGAAAPFNANQANGQPNIISVFGTGLGADVTDVDGNASDSVQALIDGAPVTTLYAGRAPGFVGLNQFNIVLPAGIISGPHTLTISRGGATSNAVSISIR